MKLGIERKTVVEEVNSQSEEKQNIFKNIPQSIQERLSKKGIITPTEIQQASFDPILNGSDILAQSETGSGKTLAFAIPLALRLMQLSKPKSGHIGSLILTPTRELASQVTEVFRSILYPLGIRCLAVTGGSSYQKQQYLLNQGIDIVIGTPGRVTDLMQRGNLNLADVKTFVLDEVDQMLDFGFAEDLNKVRAGLPSNVQTIFFSATLGKNIVGLAHKILSEPVEIKIANQASPETIEHGYVFVKVGAKLKALVNILMYYNPTQAIIFCDTKKECAEVTTALIQRNFHASQLNSDLGQPERVATMNRFRKNEIKFLVATNVAARGIDVKELSLVINFSVPKDTQSYTHRTGRTGRAGATGKAWTIITPKDLRSFDDLIHHLKIKPSHIELPHRNEILKKVTENVVQSLITDPDMAKNEQVYQVIDQALKSVPAESAKTILAGFLCQKLNTLDIYDSQHFVCRGSIKPRPSYRRYQNNYRSTDNNRSYRSNQNNGTPKSY